MYGTTPSQQPYVYRNRLAPINSVDHLNFQQARNAAVDPDAKKLAFQLASLIDPSSKTGIINPTVDRLKMMNGWDDTRLARAVTGIERSGQWITCRGTGNLPIAYLPTYTEELRRDAQTLKTQVFGTKDHTTFFARYGREGRQPLTTEQQLWIIAATAATQRKAKWNVLGSKGTHYQYKTAGGMKLTYGALFDHPYLRDHSEAGYARLAALEDLSTLTPAHGTEYPRNYTSTVPLKWIARKAGTSMRDMYQILQLQQDYYTITPIDGGRRMVLEPTLLLHQHVWDLNRRGGGRPRTAWELAHGYRPLPGTAATSAELLHSYTHCPPLGFHWLYELWIEEEVLVETVGSDGERRVITTTQERVIQVGETTKPLEERLSGHLQEPTNNHAFHQIKSHLRSGQVPFMRPVGLVHNYDIAATEVARIHYWLNRGAHLNNSITTVDRNATTIKRDSRFAEQGYRDGDVAAFLDACYPGPHPALAA